MAKLTSTLELTLLDKVSARARAINRSLDAVSRHTSMLSNSFRSVMAFGATYLGVTQGWDKTAAAAMRQEAALEEIGIKADLSGTALAHLQRQITALAPKVNQTTSELLGGIDSMVTMGLAADKAAAALPAIAKTATATKSSLTDLSEASVAAIQNMAVAPEEVSKMLEAMASAGNAGAFEMRDMAAHFPALTASAKSLGMEGVASITDMAAALQIARRGAGDASTAANNMANFLGKIMSPEVSKRFKKFGVDTTKELQKAHKKGISPIEHFIKLVDEKTKGGRADLLGQLFGDKQVLDFVRPMIADMRDYIRIRDEAARASGVVDEAYARRMATAEQKLKRLQIAMEVLGTSIGANLLAPIGDFAQRLAHLIDTSDRRFTIFDNLRASIEGFTKGLGIEGGAAGLGKLLEDFVFGADDASAAADKYGRIFKRFYEWGQAIRDFAQAVRESPIGKFFADLSPYAFDALKISLGIAVLAGAVRKLANAMMLLTGASALIGIIKAAKDATGIVGKVTTPTGKGTKPGAKDAKPGGGLWGWGTLLGALNMWDLMNQVPTDSEGVEAFRKKNLEQSKALNDWIESFGWLPKQLDASAFKVKVPGLAETLAIDEARRGKAAGFGGTTDTEPGKLADDFLIGQRVAEILERATRPIRHDSDTITGAKGQDELLGGTRTRTVSIDAASIAAMIQPAGVQDVREVNRQPPVVTVNNSIVVNGVSDPKAAANSAASQIGQKVKEAVEAAHSD